MKTPIILGLLLAVLVLFPALAAAAGPVALWLARQPVLWAFAAGIVARPRLARRIPWGHR